LDTDVTSLQLPAAKQTRATGQRRIEKPSPIVTQAKAGVQEALSSLILAFAWVAKGVFRPFFQDPDPVEQFSHFTATRL
jgi:hypothetical protein